MICRALAFVRWPLFLMALCVSFYANSLNNSFHYDDVHSIVDNVNIWKSGDFEEFRRKLARIVEDPGMFSVDPNKGMYRPVLMVTYLFNFQFTENVGVWGFHAVNLAIHAINAGLVYWLALLLSSSIRTARIASLLFALHPLGTEPVNYISSRSDSLAALFYLLGLCLFIWGRAHSRVYAQRYGAATAVALGLLSKSTVITAPAVILLYEYLWSGRRLQSLVQRWRDHVALWLAAAAYLLIITQNQFLTRSLANPVRSGWVHLLTQLKALGYYLLQFAMPTHLSVEPQFAESDAFFRGAVLFSGLLAASAVGLACRYFRHASPLALFLGCWPVMAMMPVLVMPLNVFVNERRLYLACAAFCIGSSLAVHALSQHRRSRIATNVVTTLCLLVFGTLVFQRNSAWADEMSLWKDAVHKSPRMPRNHLYLGNAHKNLAFTAKEAGAKEAESMHWNDALACYQQAIDLNSDDELALRALNNQGSVYFSLDDMEAAERVYKDALDINPNYVDALINWGNILVIKSRPVDSEEDRLRILEAITYFNRALELSPNDKHAYGSLGVAYHDLGELARAISLYRRALMLDPGNPKTLKNLGGAYFQRGKTTLTDNELAESLVLEARKDLSQALYYYGQSLVMSPNYAEAALGRDQVRNLLGEVDRYLRAQTPVGK